MSKAEVLKLVPKPQQAAQGCVATLENMLDLARKGDIVGVAVAAFDREGCTHTAYESGENFGLLIGACERVKYRLLAHQAAD